MVHAAEGGSASHVASLVPAAQEFAVRTDQGVVSEEADPESCSRRVHWSKPGARGFFEIFEAYAHSVRSALRAIRRCSMGGGAQQGRYSPGGTGQPSRRSTLALQDTCVRSLASPRQFLASS